MAGQSEPDVMDIDIDMDVDIGPLDAEDDLEVLGPASSRIHYLAHIHLRKAKLPRMHSHPSDSQTRTTLLSLLFTMRTH